MKRDPIYLEWDRAPDGGIVVRERGTGREVAGLCHVDIHAPFGGHQSFTLRVNVGDEDGLTPGYTRAEPAGGTSAALLQDRARGFEDERR